MTSATGLPAIGADVEWPDAAATAAVEQFLQPGTGRLAELARWVAGAQATATPHAPRRPRAVLIGSQPTRTAADTAHTHAITLVPTTIGVDMDDAAATGSAIADRAADEGCELIVLAASGTAADADAAAVVVSLIGGAEPVSLLPRGAAAVDTRSWIARAVALRDALRGAARLRERPDDLVTHLGSPALACAVELIMRAAARRTCVLLDGPLAAAAAVLCQDVQVRSAQWVRCADTHPDPVHHHALEDLAHRPVLDLGLDRDDGLAGLLAAGFVTTAAGLAAGVSDDPDAEDTP